MPLSLTNLCDAMRSPDAVQIGDAEFAALRRMIYQQAGISLSESKRALVCSRLAKRLRDLKLTTHAEYLHYLEHRDRDGVERQEMINCLTTNKTDFFREPHHFDFLREVVFPELAERASRGEPRRLRIWSAACSMGDEPYSLAMEAKEFPAFARGWDIRILASDISTRVLRTAESGIYPLEKIEPVAADRRKKYFLRGSGKYAGLCQVRPELKRLITFRQINLSTELRSILTSMDVIFCRNVIIYFDLPTQQKVLRSVAERLHGGGYLMLGHSESPQWLAEILSPLGGTIYQKPQVRARSGTTISAARPSGAALLTRGRTEQSPPPAKSRAAIGSEQPEGALPRRTIVAGETCASRDPLEIYTLLGSCVAACLYDPVARIGGMNHFLLPGHNLPVAVSTRYGVHAMELLINGIMKLGGDRRRLVAKVFGGANVLGFLKPTFNVGALNIEFIRKFLDTDGIPIVGQRLGGGQPLRVHFHTATGKALVKALPATRTLSRSEMLLEERIADRLLHPTTDNITLF
jgi:chemotaxis protein methyltransferase CheR